MAPVILGLKNLPWFSVRVLVTAQHRELLDQTLQEFAIVPDIDLNIMQANQSLGRLTGKLLIELEQVITSESPDVVLAQGDTTTALTAALASFYAGIDFGHIEAGLRTGNPRNPFPEEVNRIFISRLARWHFAPTQQAAAQLQKENIPVEQIHVTGNTVIDALKYIAAQESGARSLSARKALLVTAHRRENFGAPFLAICQAFKLIAARNPDVDILFPVHPNPNIRAVAHTELSEEPNIKLLPPMDYRDFVKAMQESYLILSDSGGIQEEAPALGKPVLLLRETTERPEAVEAGGVLPLGTDTNAIVEATERLLQDPKAYQRMSTATSPYGDGNAAAKIIGILQSHFS